MFPKHKNTLNILLLVLVVLFAVLFGRWIYTGVPGIHFGSAVVSNRFILLVIAALIVIAIYIYLFQPRK